MSYGYLSHHGIKGQKWGIRRYQNADGSLTSAGRQRYGMIKDTNSSYIGGKAGYIKAYKNDRNKILKDLKNDIESDETLSKKEKKEYYNSSKPFIDDFLNDKYDMKISEIAKDDASAYKTKVAVAAVVDVPLYAATGGLWTPVKINTPSSKRLYRMEKDSNTGVSTMYDRKGKVVASSNKKSKSKFAYRKVSKAVEDSEYLRTFNPKNEEERSKIWDNKKFDNASNPKQVYEANRDFLNEYNSKNAKKKKRIRDTYFKV